MINPPQVRPEEPTAVTPHGGICGGKSQQWLSYPTKPHDGICGGVPVTGAPTGQVVFGSALQLLDNRTQDHEVPPKRR